MILPKVVYDELVAAHNEGWKEIIDNLIAEKIFELIFDILAHKLGVLYSFHIYKLILFSLEKYIIELVP